MYAYMYMYVSMFVWLFDIDIVDCNSAAIMYYNISCHVLYGLITYTIYYHMASYGIMPCFVELHRYPLS